MATKKKTTKHNLPATVFVNRDEDEFDPSDVNLNTAKSLGDFYMDEGKELLVGEYQLQRVIRVAKKVTVEQEVVQEV